MKKDNITILDNFEINNIPNLDTVVLGALQLFQKKSLPKIDISKYRRPLIVGSGAAEACGRIIFSKIDAVFASESSYEAILKDNPTIDGVVLVSASGGKHAPVIAKTAIRYGKNVTLITNTENSAASNILSSESSCSEYVFPKNREPYTYNTSTYMGMILGATAENPAEIEQYIYDVIDKIELPDFSKYDKYFLIVPPEMSQIIRMFNLKFIELFGRNIARDIETSEYMRHATTVAPSNELFISFGYKNDTWGPDNRRLNVSLPENYNYGALMAIGYYVIGQIQKAYPNYYKDNIVKYTEEISKIFGQTIKPIVDNK